VARHKFSPEFINRLDKLVVLHPLSSGLSDIKGSSASATSFAGTIGCHHSGNARIAATTFRSACGICVIINELAARQLGTPYAHTDGDAIEHGR